MKAEKPATLTPYALRDAPALIESVFPAQKISFEAQRERKAGAGQTLTALGSYWKGYSGSRIQDSSLRCTLSWEMRSK